MAALEFPKTPVKLILRFIQPFIWHFSGLVFIAFLWAIDTSLEPYVIKKILDVLESNPKGAPNLLSYLQGLAFLYIVLRFFMNFISRLHDYLSLKIMPNLNRNIVIRVTKYIQKHSYSYFQNHFGGSIASKISMIADSTEAIVNNLIYDFVFPFFSLLIMTITLGTVNVFFAVILIIWTTLFIFVSYKLSFRIHTLSEQLSEKNTTLVGQLIDSLTNILAVRLFARRKFEIKVLETSAQEKVAKSEELRWSDLQRSAIMDIMSNILVFTLIYYLILERQRGKITIGDFSLVLTLSIYIIDIIWDISRNYIKFVEDLGKCSQALRTIVIPHGIKDHVNAQALNVKEGRIDFKNITLAYGNETPIFQNLSLTLKGNEKVGIVGYSGSGKTTLLNLIVRLWDLESGSILIDDQDIKYVTQDSLHRNISFIPQDPLLFNRTILENIRYGNLNASQEEVIEAAQKAHADAFIQALPQGYHTRIGERGSKLSGGQRQRLAIARAIIKNAKILILDEATSALDSETEYYIQESLNLLMQNKTVIAVAHRLSTLQKMDRLIVLNKGTIVEEGTHQSLLRKGGIYAKLWARQINKGII
jgi:ATP-binding cassette subfamily B protein